jgi:hypothetical protein
MSATFQFLTNEKERNTAVVLDLGEDENLVRLIGVWDEEHEI